MAWGAAATGARAATGSTGQGLSLMQESLAEMHARPSSRSSCSTWRAARATTSRPRAAAATATTATSCSRRWTSPRRSSSRSSRSTSPTSGATRCSSTATTSSRTPRSRSTSTPHRLRRRCRAKDWALDGSTGGTGRAKLVSPLGIGKQRDDVGYDLAEHYRRVAPATRRRCSTASSRWSRPGYVDDAELVVVAFGTPAQVRARTPCASCAPRARASAASGRSRCGRSRPTAVAARGRGRAGRRRARDQPGPDDRRRAPRRARRVRRSQFIGGLSLDSSGFGIGPTSTSTSLRARIEEVLGSMERRIERSTWSIAHRRAADRAGAPGRRLHARRCSTSASTTCARAAASRSRCARCSRRSTSSALAQRTIAVFGIGCYTAFSNTIDVDLVQALHGRAPSVATGVKRMLPDTRRVHAAGRRRHGERGPAGGAPHRGARRDRSPASCSTTACSARPAAT